MNCDKLWYMLVNSKYLGPRPGCYMKAGKPCWCQKRHANIQKALSTCYTVVSMPLLWFWDTVYCTALGVPTWILAEDETAADGDWKYKNVAMTSLCDSWIIC